MSWFEGVVMTASAAGVAVVVVVDATIGSVGGSGVGCSSELLSSSSGALKVPDGSLVIWGGAGVVG